MPDLSTNQSRLAFVTPYAMKYGLEPAIVAAVCEQESDWNPFAVRFEPAFEARYIKPALPAAPTTAELCEAMSFVLMQIMGEVAKEFGFAGRFFTQLCDPDVGVNFGCKKLQRCFIVHGNIDDTALLAYNGGGNPHYGAQVLARVAHYTTPEAGGSK